jgi:hypothetical protein
MNFIKKFLFFVHSPILISHYRNIWMNLPPEVFDIALVKAAQTNDIRQKLLDLGVSSDQIKTTIQLIEGKSFYKWSISNHPIGSVQVKSPHGTAFKTYPELFSHTRIRCMYGADISQDWSLQGWNRIYQLVLCHGPHDARVIQDTFGIETFQMGYPKHDGIASDMSENGVELNNNMENHYVLWMPSFNVDVSSWSSLDDYELILSKLSNQRVICRPHPHMIKYRLEILKNIEKSGVSLDLLPERDTSELFRKAGFVLTDFGGSIYVSIFFEKPFLVLRKEPFAPEGRGSSFDALISLLPECYIDLTNIDNLNAQKIYDLTHEVQKSRLTELRKFFFTTSLGFDGLRLASFLLKLFFAKEPL